MNRSTLQPLRSRRHVSAARRAFPAAPSRLYSVESETRQTLAAIGLIWVAAATSFAAPLPAQPRQSSPLAA